MTRVTLNKPATIYDVADRAGVSHITVSRVVNGKTNVSEGTRRRVEEAMLELGYSLNPVAQALQTRRSRVIEVISADVWGLGAPALNMIMTRAQENNYQVTIIPAAATNLYTILGSAPNRMVAGTLLYAQQIDLDYQQISSSSKNLPFVHMGGKLNSKLPSVSYDQGYATQLAMRHLIDLGHRRIGFIGGKPELLDGQLRYEAYLQALAAEGLNPGPLAFGDFAYETGAQAMQSLLDSGEPITAVFASTDEMAIGALYVLHERGLRVPQDMSIIGYNNSAICQFIHPTLTTVTNNFALLGHMSVEYLLELMQYPDTVRHQRILPSELIVRDSTCPPNPNR